MFNLSVVIRIFLYLSSSPDMIEILDLAIFNCFANHDISSWLAFPFSGTLMILIFRYSILSGVLKIPFVWQQEELGLSLTLKIIPCVVSSKNKLTYNQNTQTCDYTTNKV